MRTPQDAELERLEQERRTVAGAELLLQQARESRDRRILVALSRNCSERAVCSAAGVSRGWVFKLRKQHKE